jgi:hypothetical protein
MGIMDVLLAEALLAGCYVGISRGYHASGVDRFGEARVQISAEEGCFSGINMLVLKSGRMQSMRKWFYGNLLSACARFEEVADSPVIEGNIVGCLESACYSGDAQDGVNVKTLVSTEKLAVSNYASFKNFCTTLDTSLDNVIQQEGEYQSLTFDDVISKLLDKINQKWSVLLTRHLIAKGYRKFLSKHCTCANSVSAVKNDIVLAAKRIQIESERRMARLPVIALGKKSEIAAELLAEFDALFIVKLTALRKAVRCHNTRLLTDDQFGDSLSRYGERVTMVRNKAEGELNKLKSTTNPYIVEGNVIDLTLPADVPVKCTPFIISALTASLIADDLLLDKGIIASETAALDALNKTVSKCLVDPLANATVATLNGTRMLTSDGKDSIALKSYSECFKLAKCDNHHYHFVIAQGKQPQGFSLSNGDVRSGLNLSTYHRMDTLSDQFLKVDHGVGAATHAWWAQPQLLDFGKIGDAAVDLSGVWIGTVRDNYTILEVLSAAYPVSNTRTAWHITSTNWDNGLGYPRRLMTLKHMVFWGSVLQAVEEKVSEEWHGMGSAIMHKYSVSLKFETLSKQRETETQNLQAVGFVQTADASKLVLTSVSKEWVLFFMTWFQDNTSNGFEPFFNVGTAFMSIQRADECVLSDIRLRILPQELEAIKALKNQIKGVLKVSFQ